MARETHEMARKEGITSEIEREFGSRSGEDDFYLKA
jgi:hypothetical protein